MTIEQINSNKNTFNSIYIISDDVVQTLDGEEISTFRLVPVGTLEDFEQIVFVKVTFILSRLLSLLLSLLSRL